jgi:hypothetical protein
MLIEEKALKHWIDNFYGYGSWDARFWFIDYEEAGGDLPEEVAAKINYFYKVHAREANPTLCDIRDLYKNVPFKVEGPRSDVYTNLYDYRFSNNAVQNNPWKNLIAFAHAYKNEEEPDLLSYQKNSLASVTKNNEALLRLFPLPAHNHAWYYSWLDMPHLGFLKSRALYEEQVYQGRMRTLLTNLSVYKPQLVLMYGMENINLLKKTIHEYFPAIQFKMIKAIKQQIPQHHRADISGTTLLITTQIPSLRHNRIETGFDWKLFGESVKEETKK